MEKLLQINNNVSELTQIVIDAVNAGVDSGIYDNIEDTDNNLVIQMKTNIAVACIQQIIFIIETLIKIKAFNGNGKETIEAIIGTSKELFESVMIIEE